MSVEVGVTAAASAQAVWERFADITRWPEWNPACVGAELLGPLAPGTTMRLHLLHPHGRGFWTTPRLTEVRDGEALAWETRGFGFRAPTRVTFAAGDGETRILLASDISGPLAFTYRLTFPEKTQGGVWSGTLTALAQAVRAPDGDARER